MGVLPFECSMASVVVVVVQPGWQVSWRVWLLV